MVLKIALITGSLVLPVQHVHPDGVVDDKVGEFYATWKIPKGPKEQVRRGFCCNKQDCYQAEIRISNGRREYLHKWSNRWFPLPDEVLEASQPDPRESPDGGNHVCASPLNGWTVYCAVLGEGG